nr:MAG: hypothetical protein DIU78_13590 [Pseudomonadota bacterium]
MRHVPFADGESRHFETPAPRRVVSRAIAQELTSILADDRARRPSFGARNVLAFDYPVAAKTGTSKGFRDNFAVGYTREVTVAVWVGNFDGRPMTGSSGISGAGPVFHDVLERAMRGREPAPLIDPEGFVEREICPLSGALPTAACPHRVREHFRAGAIPQRACSFHELVPIDTRTGERACAPSPTTELRVFERYPREYEAWARAAHRPLAPPLPETCRHIGPVAARSP